MRRINFNNMNFPSKQQIDDEKPKFPLLVEEDYNLKIVEVKEERQTKYQSNDEEEVVNITFEILSYKDGTESKDVDGGSTKDRKIFFTGRPGSMGFMRDGTPAKLRSLVAIAMGQDVLEEIDLDAWQQLLGKEVSAQISQYIPEGKTERKNKIVRFIPQRREQDEEIEIPIVEG